MTIADELRKYADRALKEDGIYFSGAYLDRLARRAMSEQAENVTLRQQLADVTESMGRVEERCTKLRDALKELVVGTHAEMCADRGMWRCRECVMYHGDESCAVADAMELLGIDMYGKPMEVDG